MVISTCSKNQKRITIWVSVFLCSKHYLIQFRRPGYIWLIKIVRATTKYQMKFLSCYNQRCNNNSIEITTMQTC